MRQGEQISEERRRREPYIIVQQLVKNTRSYSPTTSSRPLAKDSNTN